MPSGEERVSFGAGQQNDVELVRRVVFQRLRTQQWTQLTVDDYGFDQFVSFQDRSYRFVFANLVREVIWEMIGSGILVPGQPSTETSQATGEGAWNLPWVQLSAYGREVLRAGRLVPQDPIGYLQETRRIANLCLGDVTEHYIEEALRCFARYCYTASVLLLGVASESSFLRLCAIYESSLPESNERRKFEKLTHIKQKHRWLLDKYNAQPADVRRNLPDGLDITLAGVYDLIRRQRNDLGHPQDIRPEVDSEHAFALFRLFLTYLRDIESLAAYIQSQGFSAR